MEKSLAIEAADKSCSYYSIHGVGVAVNCDHDEVHERIREHLSPYRVFEKPAAGEEFIVSIKYGAAPAPVPEEAKLVLHYERLHSYYTERTTYFTDYHSTLQLGPEGKHLHGNLSDTTLDEAGAAFFVDLLFNVSLFEGLRFHGLYYLHAAALTGPDGTGYLIIGNSGVGKTSLTMSLIEAGFKFLSDDTVFLRLSGDKDVEVLGFARDFHLPCDLIVESEDLSRFEGLPRYNPYKDKRRLRPDEWFGDKRVTVIKNPSIMLFPEIAENSEHVLLGKQEAFPKLLPQSLAVMFHPDIAHLHLESLRRLANHSQALYVKTGKEIKGNPEKTRRLFEKARELAREGP